MTRQDAALKVGLQFPRGFSRSTKFRWPLRRIGDYIRLNYGKALTADDRHSGPIRVFGSNGQCGWHDEALAKGPGVILGRKGQGPLGVEWCDDDFWVIDTAYFVAPTSEDISLKFFFYATQYIGLNHLKDGTSNPSLSREVFYNQAFPVPPLYIQNRIAELLSFYDDLIDINNRRICILNETARRIYREWFVEFRFPGHEKAHLSEHHGDDLPSGWQWVRVGDAFEVLGGATPSTKEPAYWDAGTIPWFSPSDLTRSKRMFLSEGEKKITLSGLENCSARLFPPYSVMMTSRATLGVLAINKTPACTNQGFITCIPNDRITCSHLYLWLAASAAELEMLATGATFKEITKRAFKDYGVVLAPPDIERLFFERTWPLLQMIETLEAQNENLRMTRDLLLPKLLSGEVDISTINTEQLT